MGARGVVGARGMVGPREMVGPRGMVGPGGVDWGGALWPSPRSRARIILSDISGSPVRVCIGIRH